MPTISTKTRVTNLIVPLTGSSIVQSIYSPEPWLQDSVSTYGLIKTLTLRAELTSLEEVNVPEFDFPGNDLDRYTKSRDNTWTKARYQMDLCLRTDGGEWREYVSLSVQNHKSIPYTSQPLLEYMSDGLAYGVSENTELGVRFKSAGFGLPSPNDRMTIFGEIHQEAQVRSSVIESCTPKSWSINDSSSVIEPSDPLRRQVLIVNPSENAVWVSRSDTALIGAGLVILPGGNLTVDRYNGPISAISEVPTEITGEVCV